MNTTTPKSVNDAVLALRGKIGLETTPVFVPVRDTAGHIQGECYGNVERKVATEGGSIQYGWNVWEDPNRFIEGEFHAVWVSAEGELVDITPHADGEDVILFIPDPNRVYENEPIDNVRLALCDDPEVLELIRAGELYASLAKKYNDGTGRSEIPLDAFLGSLANRPSTPHVRAKKKIGRNEPCPCGSGEKYKRCCAN